MIEASFAIPGDLSAPTGGYAYARRLLRGAQAQGVMLHHLAVPDGYPTPRADALGRTAEILAAAGKGPLLIDGLCFGALPRSMIRSLDRPVIALCHHPLAMEAGLSAAMVAHLHKTEQAALGLAQHVITTSHATAAILSRDYDVPAACLTVAPPGTDPAPRAPGSGSGICQILSVGSLIRRKGHDRLIRALAPLRGKAWHLRIVGAVRDDALADELRALIGDLGLAGQVMLTGPLSVAALTAAYQQADLFALASEYEGFGMVFAEALAHGLPVVGLQSAAVEEATAGAARLVVPEALGPALAALIGNAAERRKLADQCWCAAQTLLRWPNTVAIVARVLKEAEA